MAVAPLYDRVMVTSTTTSTGTLTLGAAVTGYQTFAAIGNGNTTPMAIWEVDANGNPSGAWETADGCTYTESGTTLTRGTFRSSSTGSAIDLAAGTKRVAQVLPASILNACVKNARGYILGGKLVYNSTTALNVEAGKFDINGVVVELAAGTFTSASTMKDIANSTVTLGASAAYWVFGCDSSVTGGARYAIEKIDGTGDGAALVRDLDLGYWKAASTGAAARRIGKFLTNASSQIIKFTMSESGRIRRYVDALNGAITLLAAGTSTTYASLTITPYISADDLFLILVLGVKTTSGTGPASIAITVTATGGVSSFALGYATTVISYAPSVSVPNTGTLHYLVGSTNTGEVYLSGFELQA